MERIPTSTKIFTLHIEDLPIKHRADLFDWLCSPAIQKGKATEKYWIIKTDTQIHNQHADIDVFNLMRLMQESWNNGYQSLIIMKHGINRPADSKPSEAESNTRPQEPQQADTTTSGEVPTGEPRSEVPPSTPHSEDNRGGE